jgi:hypothetical protein
MSELYKYKDLKYGFIILCPNLNTGHIRNTIGSTDICYPDAKTVVIVPTDCNKEDLESLSKLKKTYKGGKTIASMINAGMKHASIEWNFILFPKGWIKSRIDIKYSYFVESEKDILFPIVNRKLTFDKADINGLFIHKKAFQDIGDFPDMDNLDISKLIWTTNAIEKGYKFKGIVGAKPF